MYFTVRVRAGFEYSRPARLLVTWISVRWSGTCPACYPPFGAPTRRALPAEVPCRRRLRERASVMPDRTLVASWTPYEWRRAHERGSGGDSEVGQGADWREAIRAKVKEGTSL